MNELLDRLKRISLFADLQDDAEALQAIAALMRPRAYPAERFIIREGESGDTMYILASGSVRIEKRTLAGDVFTIAQLTEDMDVFFGEIALLDSDVRSASVRAATKVDCFEIRKSDFDALCRANPKIGFSVLREIAKSLAVRLRKTTADSATLIAALIQIDEV